MESAHTTLSIVVRESLVRPAGRYPLSMSSSNSCPIKPFSSTYRGPVVSQSLVRQLVECNAVSWQTDHAGLSVVIVNIAGLLWLV